MKNIACVTCTVMLLAAAWKPQACADVIIGNAELVAVTPTIPPYTSTVLLSLTDAPDSALGVLVGDLGSGDFEFTTGLIALDYRLFSATPGLDFSPSNAEDVGSALVPGSSVQHFSINETKYFAYWADKFPSDPQPDSGDYYGWVSLTYGGSELVISDSATAAGGGIIVGTYTQIPEPSSVLLLIVGAIGLWRRMRSG